MMAIQFTQFIRPDGRRKLISIERPADIEDKARKITAAGCVFECENLQNGKIYLDCCNSEAEIAIEIVPNNEAVPAAVDAIVNLAFERLGLS